MATPCRRKFGIICGKGKREDGGNDGRDSEYYVIGERK